MKKFSLLVALLLLSCGPSPEQLYETAEFEVLQTNYPHAVKLYQEIVDKHPESEVAEAAGRRLLEIKARQEAEAIGQGQ